MAGTASAPSHAQHTTMVNASAAGALAVASGEFSEEPGPGLDHVLRADMLLERARKRAMAAQGFKHQGREVLWRMQANRCMDLLRSALEFDPSNLSACYMLIGCLLEHGDFEAAKEQAHMTLHDVLQSKGATLQEPALHLAAAQASLGAGATSEAVDLLLEAAKLFPEDPQPCVALSLAMRVAGRPEGAKHAADLAVQRNSKPGSAARLTAEQLKRVKALLSGGCSDITGEVAKSAASSEPPSGFPGRRLPGESFAEGLRRLRANKAQLGSVSGGGVASGEAFAEKPSPRGISARIRGVPIREFCFGPQVPGIGVGSPRAENAVREAALKDLETLFSNLLPRSALGMKGGPPRVNGEAVVSEGMSGCCSCRRVNAGSSVVET